MDWLNYHHLYYFWSVAREGTITGACEKLRLAQPTISRQIGQLEEALGEQLFTKSGRLLKLTDVGQVVFEYAEEIFPIGQELLEVLRGKPRSRPARFHVGISDAIPKLVAFRLLEPALTLDPAPQLVCQEDKPDGLLLRLASHTLDMVLSDAPLTNATYRARAFNHELGSCGVTFFATAADARRLQRGFPRSLHEQRFLLPLPGSSIRRSLDGWFDRYGIRPRVAGEFQDSALLKVFGQAGGGVFAGPSAIEAEIRKQYGVAVVGRTEEIIERFYAVSLERKVRHPAALAISETARAKLF